MSDVLAWSKAVLQTMPDHWVSLTQTLPAEILTRKPSPGEWSALDCLQHLVDTERQVFPARVERLLAGKDFPAFDPDAQGSQPAVLQDAALFAQEFAALRADSLKLWEKLSEGDLNRTSRHSELGMVTLRELLNEWAGHDLMHTVQAERALMQPFIEGCGPWRSYFMDHIAASDG